MHTFTYYFYKLGSNISECTTNQMPAFNNPGGVCIPCSGWASVYEYI